MAHMSISRATLKVNNHRVQLQLTDDEASFRKAICWNPADDAPRLIYADWLDEHGKEEHAEFIRLQIEHAELQFKEVKIPKHGMYELGKHLALQQEMKILNEFQNGRRRKEIQARIQELLQYWSLFTAPTPFEMATIRRDGALEVCWCPHKAKSYEEQPLIHSTLKRGLISEISFGNPGLFMKFGAEIFTCHPIEKLTILDGIPRLPDQHDEDLVVCNRKFGFRQITDLNATCLNWARRQVGLPKLIFSEASL